MEKRLVNEADCMCRFSAADNDHHSLVSSDEADELYFEMKDWWNLSNRKSKSNDRNHQAGQLRGVSADLHTILGRVPATFSWGYNLRSRDRIGEHNPITGYQANY